MPYKTDLHQLTGLGRPIVLSNQSNLIAVVGSAIVGAVIFTISWMSDGSPDLIASTSGAIGSFLAWAIARELDPDRPRVGTFAIIGAGVLAVVAPPASLFVGVLLLALRVMVNSVGAVLRVADWIVLIGAAGYAGTQAIGWPIAVVLVFAVARRSDTPGWLAPGMVLASLVAGLTIAEMPETGTPDAGASVVIIASLVVGIFRIQPPPVSALSDIGASSIETFNVMVARMLTLSALGFIAVLAPQTAVTDVGPVIAAVLGLSLARDRVLPAQAVSPGEIEYLDEAQLPEESLATKAITSLR